MTPVTLVPHPTEISPPQWEAIRRVHCAGFFLKVVLKRAGSLDYTLTMVLKAPWEKTYAERRCRPRGDREALVRSFVLRSVVGGVPEPSDLLPLFASKNPWVRQLGTEALRQVLRSSASASGAEDPSPPT